MLALVWGKLPILRKKQTLCQTNHSVYMYKIGKRWGKQTVVKNVEIKHKEIKLSVLSTLGYADKVGVQGNAMAGCGRAGNLPWLLLGRKTDGMRCK